VTARDPHLTRNGRTSATNVTSREDMPGCRKP
jgi:hypothetical protein